MVICPLFFYHFIAIAVYQSIILKKGHSVGVLSTVFWQRWTYICTDALSSLWDLGEGIVDGGDVGDDRLLIWRRNINVCGGKVKNSLFGSAVGFRVGSVVRSTNRNQPLLLKELNRMI